MRPNTTGLSLGSLLLLPGLLLLLSITGAEAANKPKNAILLSEVQSLTLKAGRQTTSRRVSPIPQLKCVSPRGICSLHEIDTLRCVNQGSSYSKEDVEWACTATDLPTTLRLGSTEVICEGYSSPDDPYVLRGSCGVEYRLVLTEEGEKRYPELTGKGGSSWKKAFAGDNNENGETDWAGYLFAILFFSVLGWIIYSACMQAQGEDAARRVGQAGGRRPGGGGGGGGGGWGPGWGGGGGGGWDDPPPPYSKSSYTRRAGGADQAWRPGFWTGAATGAAAGYFAGNRGGNNNTAGSSSWRQQPRRDNGEGSSSSFWGGGGGGGGGSSGSSSGRHESTGFGSTSRR